MGVRGWQDAGLLAIWYRSIAFATNDHDNDKDGQMNWRGRTQVEADNQKGLAC